MPFRGYLYLTMAGSHNISIFLFNTTSLVVVTANRSTCVWRPVCQTVVMLKMLLPVAWCVPVCLLSPCVHLSAVTPALGLNMGLCYLCGLCACVCVHILYIKRYSTVLSSWLLILLAVGWCQEYMKLSDVYKMYGSSGLHENNKPPSHGRSFAVDAALAGAGEVPSLPVFPDSVLTLYFLLLPLSVSLSIHFHVMLLPLLVCC